MQHRPRTPSLHPLGPLVIAVSAFVATGCDEGASAAPRRVGVNPQIEGLTCGDGTHAADPPDAGSPGRWCVPDDVCEAGTRVCTLRDGRWSVLECAADGTGWAVAEACAETCLSGVCSPRYCVPEDRFCSGDTARWCRADGTALEAEQCDEGQCDEGRCPLPACQSGLTWCDGSDLVRCNARGTAVVAETCPGDQYCEAGRCRDVHCEPGTSWCAGDTRVTCALSGSELLEDPCGPGAECADGRCEEVCEVGARGCMGNVVATCDPDTRRLVPGEDCGELACDEGRCVDCAPEDHRTCHDGDAYWVDSCGERGDLAEACSGGERCSNGRCTEPPCELDCSGAGVGLTCGTGSISCNYGYNGSGCRDSAYCTYSNGRSFHCNLDCSGYGGGTCSGEGDTCSF